MKKVTLSWLLIVVMLFGTAHLTYAHPKQSDHDNDLQTLLLGEGSSLTGEKKERFQAIADAAALCIDQFSSNEDIRSKEDLFNQLNEREKFSFSFDDIELQKGSDGKNVTAKTHRRYTHRGWDFSEYPLKDLWARRKKILTATVNRELFGVTPGIFSKLPVVGGLIYDEEACNKECESFCKLVYYIHILGDFEESTTYSSEVQQLTPLVRHEDQTAPALIDEIIDLTPVLFKDQSWTYPSFVDKLKEIKSRAEKLPFAQNAAWTEDQFKEYHKCAEDVMDAIKEYVPDMLSRTEFFKDAFY